MGFKGKILINFINLNRNNISKMIVNILINLNRYNINSNNYYNKNSNKMKMNSKINNNNKMDKIQKTSRKRNKIIIN